MFGDSNAVTVGSLPLEKDDRVAAYHDGQMRKGRVSEGDALGLGMVGVTFEKGQESVMFKRADVMPLYRYVTTPQGQGVVPLCFAPADK